VEYYSTLRMESVRGEAGDVIDVGARLPGLKSSYLTVIPSMASSFGGQSSPPSGPLPFFPRKIEYLYVAIKESPLAR
jgi:hypothetical protein